jgi:hypothetical protein
MPIVARRTSDQLFGSSVPSAVLLPTDGILVPVQPPAPMRTLAAEAVRIARWRAPGPPPVAWSEPGFIREVGLVRAHLAPIRSQAALEASYGREAFHSIARNGADKPIDDDAAPSADVPGPVRVAYAIRWLELSDGHPRPAWPATPEAPNSAA